MVRRFGASLPMRMHHGSGPWTYRIQGCGATESRPKAGSPLIVIATALACRRARSCQGMAWQGRSMPQGWGDSTPRTDPTRIDVSDAQVGTKKRALRSNQETDEGKHRRPLANSLTKKTPYKGPGADSEEKREPVSDIHIAVADSLKVLELKRPIRKRPRMRGGAICREGPNRRR
jgi:hypothetical protein